MSEWKTVKLGDVCEIIMGQSPSGNSYNSKGEGTPFFQGKAEFGVRFPTVKKWTTEPSKIAIEKDILMSVRAPVGSTNINIIECCIGRGLCVIRPHKEKADYLYVYHFLNKNEKAIENLGVGSTFKAINRKQLEQLEIPLPPLPVQKQIVSILEKAENLKQKRNETNKETQKIIQSLFYEMFGDPFKSKEKLKQEKISKLISKIDMTNPKEIFGSNSFKYVDISSIDRDLKKITSHQEILGIDAPSRARQLIKTGDLLISTVRPNLNSVSLVDESFNNQICSTGYCVLRLNKEKILPEYVFAISKMKSFVDLLMSKAKGASYPAVSNKDITEIKINLPPLPLQKEFAKKVQLIESIQSKQQSSTKEINTLFDALMSKAFKGELT